MTIALATCVALGAQAGIAQDPKAPPADGAPRLATGAQVERTCTACHVAAQFTSQRRTREQWAETVNTMIGYGAQVSDEEFEPIVNYLAANFGNKAASSEKAK
ncbi:hypothetical protein [Sphingomonas quercus]|uniref:hypothetical protein n=1 Tax=Sphingomonas quercus TaxID=2842451 RepID=UPI001C0DDEC8|nr:hypothetical protein [Sphingomonas quercus]